MKSLLILLFITISSNLFAQSDTIKWKYTEIMCVTPYPPVAFCNQLDLNQYIDSTRKSKNEFITDYCSRYNAPKFDFEKYTLVGYNYGYHKSDHAQQIIQKDQNIIIRTKELNKDSPKLLPNYSNAVWILIDNADLCNRIKFSLAK